MEAILAYLILYGVSWVVEYRLVRRGRVRIVINNKNYYGDVESAVREHLQKRPEGISSITKVEGGVATNLSDQEVRATVIRVQSTM